jgi:uncharacterized protein
MNREEAMNTWPDHAGEVLLPVARSVLRSVLAKQALPIVELPDWVHQQGACFVTLTQHGELRGCIGTLIPHRSLYEDVKENVVMAATQDPRFKPLSLSELERTRIELSVLSPVEKLPWMSEEEALKFLRPGVDGVIIECRGRRGTFLPQVWEQLPHPKDFLAHLKNKAGLGTHFWSSDVYLSRYTVNKWKEKGS